MKQVKREQFEMKLPKQAQPVTRVANPGVMSGDRGVDASFWGDLLKAGLKLL